MIIKIKHYYFNIPDKAVFNQDHKNTHNAESNDDNNANALHNINENRNNINNPIFLTNVNTNSDCT